MNPHTSLVFFWIGATVGHWWSGVAELRERRELLGRCMRVCSLVGGLGPLAVLVFYVGAPILRFWTGRPVENSGGRLWTDLGPLIPTLCVIAPLLHLISFAAPPSIGGRYAFSKTGFWGFLASLPALYFLLRGFGQHF